MQHNNNNVPKSSTNWISCHLTEPSSSQSLCAVSFAPDNTKVSRLVVTAAAAASEVISCSRPKERRWQLSSDASLPSSRSTTQAGRVRGAGTFI